MNILITGATGFVGAAVARALADRGDTVRGLSRTAREASPGAAIGEWFVWRGAGSPMPVEALKGVDAVIHLAGESVVGRWSAAKKQRIRSSRVDGTRALVEAMRQAGPSSPKTLISASAIGFYGDRGDEELSELSTSPEDDFLAEVCRAWEAEAEEAQELGVRVVCVRIGLVMHPHGGALKAMMRPFKLGFGGRLGSGRQWQSWIHREDLVGLVLHALDRNDVSGPMNATAPTAVQQKTFATALGKAMRRPSFMPAPALALKAMLGEFSVELLSSKRVVPAVAQRSGYAFRFPELQSALGDLLNP